MVQIALSFSEMESDIQTRSTGLSSTYSMESTSFPSLSTVLRRNRGLSMIARVSKLYPHGEANRNFTTCRRKRAEGAVRVFSDSMQQALPQEAAGSHRVTGRSWMVDGRN
jgi:hypothetical protein